MDRSFSHEPHDLHETINERSLNNIVNSNDMRKRDFKAEEKAFN
jgi:hypothetical protein